jgi:hypothetical protein
LMIFPQWLKLSGPLGVLVEEWIFELETDTYLCEGSLRRSDAQTQNSWWLGQRPTKTTTGAGQKSHPPAIGLDEKKTDNGFLELRQPVADSSTVVTWQLKSQKVEFHRCLPTLVKMVKPLRLHKNNLASKMTQKEDFQYYLNFLSHFYIDFVFLSRLYLILLTEQNVLALQISPVSSDSKSAQWGRVTIKRSDPKLPPIQSLCRRLTWNMSICCPPIY